MAAADIPFPTKKAVAADVAIPSDSAVALEPNAIPTTSAVTPPSPGSSLDSSIADRQRQLRGSTFVTSPSADTATHSSHLPSQEGAAPHSTPSTSPEIDPAQGASCEPDRLRTLVERGGDDAAGAADADDADAEPTRDISCALRVSSPIAIRLARDTARRPASPLDRATAYNIDNPPARPVPPAVPIDAVPLDRPTVPSADSGGDALVQPTRTAVRTTQDGLFAKRSQTGKYTVPHSGSPASAHAFWTFPPLDISESNREFDKKYLTPTPYPGIDMSLVEGYIDHYADETSAVTGPMDEHNDQYAGLQNAMSHLKMEQKRLENSDRQLARVATCLKRNRLPASFRARLPSGDHLQARMTQLAKVQLAKAQNEVRASQRAVATELAKAQDEVRERVIRGNTMIADALALDFGLPELLHKEQTMKLERERERKAQLDLLTSAVKLGLRPGGKEQDETIRLLVQQSLEARNKRDVK